MSEREDNVYKAKLAEQAERYDGECPVRAQALYFRGKAGRKIADSELGRCSRSLLSKFRFPCTFRCQMTAVRAATDPHCSAKTLGIRSRGACSGLANFSHIPREFPKCVRIRPRCASFALLGRGPRIGSRRLHSRPLKICGWPKIKCVAGETAEK